MLEDKIRGLDQFRLVMLVNRAQAQNWLPWIDSLVAQNRLRGRRQRNLRFGTRYGTKPCFPRTLAMAGHHMASLVLLETTAISVVNEEENRWEKVLGPCSNAVAPYVGPQLYPPVSVPEYAPIPTDPLSDPTDP